MTPTALDVAALRATTPGCAAGAHFNHAGASLVSAGTLAAVTGYLEYEAVRGPHEAAAEVAPRLDRARGAAAKLLGAGTDEIAFTSSGSAGWGLAFAALPPLEKGDRVLVGRHEWGGNLATLRVAADRAGSNLEVIPCREDGSVDPEALANMVDERVKLVSLTWLPANGGLINDAAAVGRVARAAKIPFFVDAGQALGQLPIDVGALGCDVLKGAGRKHLRGPRGTAVLYIRRDFRPLLKPVFFDVLSAPWGVAGPEPRVDARAFETSELPVALLLGLGNAIEEALGLGIEAIRARIKELATRLRDGLGAIPGIIVRDLGIERSGIVAFTVAGLNPEDARGRLARQSIAVGANGPAYTPLDMAARGLTGIVRASLSYLNTTDEVDRLVAAVAELAGGQA